MVHMATCRISRYQLDNLLNKCADHIMYVIGNNCCKPLVIF